MRRLPNLLLLTGLLGLVAACSDQESMPLQPTAPAGQDAWRTVYPALTTADLNTAWGMDADDLWIGGDDGTMLHWNGQRLERADLPTGRDVERITGLGRDDVWARAGDDLLHFDGHRWSLAHALDFTVLALHVDGSGQLYVGGYARVDHDNVPVARRRVGERWFDLALPPLPDRVVSRIWRPSPAHPIMATTGGSGDEVLRLQNGRWEIVAEDLPLYDVDGDLAVTGWWILDDQNRLLRFATDGSLVELCPDRTFAYARAVLRSRHLLLVDRDAVWTVSDCSKHLLTSPRPGGADEYVTPVRPGPDSAAIFAVGREGAVLRGAWQPDGGLVWDSLHPGVHEQLEAQLAGDRQRLYADAGSQLLIEQDGAWSVQELGFGINDLRALAGGRLLITGNGELVIREPAGALTPVPDPPSGPWDLRWCDGEQGWAVDHDRTLWRLAGGAWSPLDTLETGVHGLAASTPDVVYLIAGGRLLRHDGESLEDIHPHDLVSMRELYVAPLSDRVFCKGFNDATFETYRAVLEDGVWTTISGPFVFEDHTILEITPELVVTYWESGLFRFRGDRWELFDEVPAAGIRGLWGHPDRGLFVTTVDGRILHRPYPSFAPGAGS